LEKVAGNGAELPVQVGVGQASDLGLEQLHYPPPGVLPGLPAASAPPERLDPAVADLVQRLEPFPTLVKGRRWDVLAANPAARELFADWAAGSAGERNLVRWMFTTDQAREVYLEWEPEARAMLGRFRLSAARYPDDPDVRTLIAELQRDSEHVRDWWPRHDVAAIGGSGPKKLRHPRFINSWVLLVEIKR
jgi:hypothetical protein